MRNTKKKVQTKFLIDKTLPDANVGHYIVLYRHQYRALLTVLACMPADTVTTCGFCPSDWRREQWRPPTQLRLGERFQFQHHESVIRVFDSVKAERIYGEGDTYSWKFSCGWSTISRKIMRIISKYIVNCWSTGLGVRRWQRIPHCIWSHYIITILLVIGTRKLWNVRRLSEAKAQRKARNVYLASWKWLVDFCSAWIYKLLSPLTYIVYLDFRGKGEVGNIYTKNL